MSKYVIDSSTLTSIADAVRAKTGSTDPIKVSDIPTEISKISGGESLPDDAFIVSGDCAYRFYGGGWDWFIKNFGNRVTTRNISNASWMFNKSKTRYIPFDINFEEDTYSYNNALEMFYGSYNLREAPVLNNLHVYTTRSMFNGCTNLRTVPENFADTWNWKYLEKQTSGYTGDQARVFQDCYSLRSFPVNIFKSGNPYVGANYSYFVYGFYACCTLNELINLPIPYTKATWTSNAFNKTFISCSRLKNITFALNNGVPYTVTWKSQVIDLTNYVGFSDSNPASSGWNNGITADKQVKDDATYQALKNDPDWFTMDINYSRYNHDSAVATINSLPDTSAYLTTAGGTNTIKFQGASGTKTDGGAISNLTSEEIAVATAKGWTVTLS